MNESATNQLTYVTTTAAEYTDSSLPWEDWLESYGAQLLLYARQFAGPGEAEDLVQEAFLRLWRRRDTIRGDFNPKAALHQGIKWAAFDLFRSRSRRQQREDAAAVLDGPPITFFESPTVSAERTEAIEVALQELPEEQREVLVLKIWSEFTFAEIADQLAISPNTAASRYRYALSALRKILDRGLQHG